MSRRFDVAVLGADSVIGHALLELIAERRFPVGEISALALGAEQGASVDFAGTTLMLDDATAFDFTQAQLCFLASDDPRLAAQAERAADAGCVVIDAGGTLWRDPEIPRVVPEINAPALRGFQARGIVAAPDALVVPLALALAPLHRLAGIRRIAATAIVPVSDAGRLAFEDLARETVALLNARHYERRHFPQQIAFNLIGQIGPAGAGGATERERRVIDDLRALLDTPELAVGLTVVQGAVFYGYALAVEVQLAAAQDFDAIVQALRTAPGLELIDSLEAADCPSPVTDATSTEAVRLARLRPGSAADTVMFWLTADNVRRAAALNALASAEILVREHL
ncbi:Aspartate-semialdehyde dehydrogenase [Fontimonas thermophila]|uniref:Aspartate-semialdehyde dehydrogenase n=1 Tax=Fontimonas thermophila TaxID=1076937 RepID=A0A1I2HLT2_9GAMM|nr:aspartate-semialdehyde dehydrogenase [Fontimonas thermophila]SFF31295.1 Aspartate-semialdehyde dehydrogenase [Fontimonas thermophila]